MTVELNVHLKSPVSTRTVHWELHRVNIHRRSPKKPFQTASSCVHSYSCWMWFILLGGMQTLPWIPWLLIHHKNLLSWSKMHQQHAHQEFLLFWTLICHHNVVCIAIFWAKPCFYHVNWTFTLCSYWCNVQLMKTGHQGGPIYPWNFPH